MAKITGTFTASGNAGTPILVKKEDSVNYSLTVAGAESFIGTVQLQKSLNGGQSWSTVQSFVGTVAAPLTGSAASGTYTGVDKKESVIRFRCDVLSVVEGEESDNIVWEITEVENISTGAKLVDGQIMTPEGTILMRFKEGGVQFPVNVEIGGTLDVDQEVRTTHASGAKNGATVVAVEYGDGVIHKTVLTLTATPISIVSVTTGNGVGGTRIYDFPLGRILHLGTMANLSIAVPTGKQADFTDATPEGDVGVGSVAPANADTFGTDETDDDYSTGKPFTMTAYAATAKSISEPAAQFAGTTTDGTAKDVYVNILIDAADIDNDTTTSIEVSGTVTINWVNLGDL